MTARVWLTAVAASGVFALGLWGLALHPAHAHCDGLDGPVVAAARTALAAGDVTPVLKWVKSEDEAGIRSAFAKTIQVRRQGPGARDLADMYFFETLVRVHRAGEGAPYTGLKPAGRDLGPAIPAADRALQDGSLEPLEKLLTDAVREGLRERYQEARARKSFREDDVRAGREYVKAYVTYIHYVEGLYEAAQKPSGGHHPEPEDHAAAQAHPPH